MRADADDDRDEIGPKGKPFTSNPVVIGLFGVAARLLLYPRLSGPVDPFSVEAAGGARAVSEDTAATAPLGRNAFGLASA